MTAEPMTSSYPPVRAPSADGQTLQQPPADQFGSLWQSNQRTWAAHSFELHGKPIELVRSEAQADLLQRAIEYCRTYRDVPTVRNDQNLILAGHQPELFHPGVWYKNFVLSGLADSLDATAVNLVIDNDLRASTEIVVPGGGRSAPKLQRIAFDRPRKILPYESATLDAPELWNSFESRVKKTIEPLVANPIIGQLWPHVVESIDAGTNPVYALAGGRHRLESSAGLETLEVPLGELCKSVSYATFCAELISRHQELFQVYNESLMAFRTENRIRSQSHPVPGLTTNHEWTELPLWIWTADNPTRRPAFVKESKEGLVLSDGDQLQLPLDTRSLIDQLSDLSKQEIVLRPRALITTMYSRLVLGQMFIHGIGGAKYDQLTDTIIQRFFGVTPPEFITLSATHLLPVGVPDANEHDVAQLKNKRRALVYHPEWFADANDPNVNEVLSRKQSLIDELPTTTDKRQWHHQMVDVNQRLQEFTSACQLAVAAEERDLDQQLGIKRVLGSREFSFCLFPTELIEKLKNHRAN